MPEETGRGHKQKIGSVEVKTDGRAVPVKGFVQDFIGFAVIGMLSTLRGVDSPREIEVKIKVNKNA